MTITPRVDMITRQKTLFFSSNFSPLSDSIFHFCISRPSKFSSMGSPLWNMFWSVKYTFTYQRSHFQAYISFFYIKFAKFLYIKCFVPDLTPVEPHGLQFFLSQKIYFTQTNLLSFRFLFSFPGFDSILKKGFLNDPFLGPCFII